MAPQQRSQAAPSRKSRRLKFQTAAGADMQRVRKSAKNKKGKERKKRNKARGEDACKYHSPRASIGNETRRR